MKRISRLRIIFDPDTNMISFDAKTQTRELPNEVTSELEFDEDGICLLKVEGYDNRLTIFALSDESLVDWANNISLAEIVGLLRE